MDTSQGGSDPVSYTHLDVYKRQQSFHDYYAVTVDCKNPKLAVQWLDWVYASEESAVLRYWGFEGDTFTVENGQKVFTDKVTNGGSSAIDVMRGIGAWPNFCLLYTSRCV